MNKNTLNNVIKQLENKGYKINIDNDYSRLEIISPNGYNYLDIKPIYIKNNEIYYNYSITDFIDKDLSNVCIEFYNYFLDYPTSNKLIKEIEESFI